MCDEPRLESLDDHPGVPDELQRLWTPYRMVYIDGENKPTDGSVDECPFCRAPSQDDEESLIVYRGEHCYAICNLYPYNPGHMLICTYRHVANYIDLTADETREMATLTQHTIRVINSVSKPAGYNLGMNQGTAGGAGVAAHIHQHVVPRWHGDANFLPIIGKTKAIPMFLADTRRLFATAWETISSGEADA